MRRKRLVFSALILFAASLVLAAQEYTRGVGVYPGDPNEDFAPVIATSNAYRNLALNRPAYHSSSYDYNLTAQLVTDGIKETKPPRWLATSTGANGVARKNERELLLDGNTVSTVNLNGATAWVQFELEGGEAPFEIDRIELETRMRAGGQRSGANGQGNGQAASQQAARPEWTCTVTGSDDGQTWKELGRTSGVIAPPPQRPAGARGGFTPPPPLRPSVAFAQPARNRFYRITLSSQDASAWSVAEVNFFDKNSRVQVGGPNNFSSAWMPEGKGEEWVYVDLGARCAFDRVALFWIRRAAEGSLQISDDAKTWTDLQALPAANELSDNIRLARPAEARYVRLLLKRPASPEGYALSEMEVYGRGGPVARPRPAPGVHADGRLDITGGGWRVQRASLVSAKGEELSILGFKDTDWIVATVPGTVLSSYWNAGAVPDPNYADNQLMISDSFFCSDFWYRDEFTAPRVALGSHIWLNFDGINWKADVYLNGEKLGRIEGGFMRGRFDVTGRVKPGQKNALAVLVERNATPGSTKQKTLESPGLNGGALGADNPTYHAAIGWDWIPTVRGRDSGIWNDVYLTSSGSVTIENPFVSTTLPLPDTSRADLSVQVGLHNSEERAVSGTLHGQFGDVVFEQAVTVPPSSTQTVVLNPSNHAELRLKNPRLWWPNGYGDPNLYDVKLSFEVAGTGKVSDQTAFKAGVRQFTYSEEGGVLKMWINGRRFVARGGNWGFPESMLRYRAREYDIAVRYHRDMNFTMIRNWVGQTGDDEFYDACDRYGIVVWQDFWLANPADGPDPDDNNLFMQNARDTVLRIRNHASIGLYCGRNEGYPPKPLEEGIRQTLGDLHPGLHYISSSADDVVSGHGFYRAMPVKTYFQQRATTKLHSEMGMPNIVTIDSLRQMMPESALWPQNLTWGLHDFCLNGAQGGSSFRSIIDKSYGGADNAAEWTMLAQFVNYEGYRAMFEAQGKNRMGLLLWMSHPAWPSFVWQTYDYYFEPTGAYFGSKKGSEPLHIQWNPTTDNVEVVNYSGGNARALTARAEVLNIDGTVKWEKTASVDSAEDSIQTPIKIEFPPALSAVHFIRLRLTRGSGLVSENFYWRGTEDTNYTALSKLPKVKVEAATQVERQGSAWVLTTELRNASNTPALMVKLKAVREKTGDRVLPALFSDNYVALMPGERRTIRTELANADTRGEKPRIVVEGFNVQ